MKKNLKEIFRRDLEKKPIDFKGEISGTNSEQYKAQNKEIRKHYAPISKKKKQKGKTILNKI